MKKLFLVLIVVLFAASGFCGQLDEKVEAKTEHGFCPITKVSGTVDACFRCHTKGNFKVMETDPFATWDMPYGAKMAMIDGKAVCVYTVSGGISGIEGTRIDDVFTYLHSNHPEVRKMIMKIHSGGGSLFGGYQAVGVMKDWIAQGYEIETRVNGFAASAAFFMFAAGSTRLVSPQAELMWHELITFSMFDVSGPADKEDQAAVLRHLQDNANSMLADLSNLTKAELDTKIRKKEFWMTGIEALEFGFATGILK